MTKKNVLFLTLAKINRAHCEDTYYR